MPVSLDQFAHNLAASGLMSAEEIAAFQEGIPPGKRPRTGEELGKALVQSGRLTPYQAAAVEKGEIRGLVFGEYVILDKLGQGGMGVVFKARHRRMNRLVAIKTLPAGRTRSPEAVERFYHEVRAAAQLSHPNIVAAHDAGEHEGMLYLVMEYVDGPDLAAILREHGPLPVSQAIHCILQAARGLEYAHQHGIVHRDIKPSNLLVDREGRVKVLDMGLARIDVTRVSHDSAREERLTVTGAAMGTCDYMAPEQAQSARHADHRADIYSLGCTLFRLLTGRLPYPGETPIEVLLAHREAEIPSLRAARPEVSPELDATVQKMLAKRPEDRYQSMSAVIGALAAYLAGAERMTEAADDAIESAHSISSWLERVSRLAVGTPPKTATAMAVSEETRLHAAEQETRLHARKPASSMPAAKRFLLVGGLAAGGAVVLGLLLVLTQRGKPPDAAPTTDEKRQTVARDNTPSGKKTIQLKPEAKPKPPDWEALWEVADLRAKAMVGERRFGEAIEEYRALVAHADDPVLRERVSEVVARLDEVAAQTYRDVQARARELLAEKRYAEARAALQPAIDRYGVTRISDEAKRLLAEIKAAENPPPPKPSPAELVAKKELERQRQLEGRYAEATRPVEALAASWDFRGAATELNKTRFEEPELDARLAQRRQELKRMHDLKRKLIAAINQASPPLKKTALGLKGLGGEVTKADQECLTATLVGGKTETIPWSSIGATSLPRLFAPKQFQSLMGATGGSSARAGATGGLSTRADAALADKQPVAPTADDWLAAGLVSLAVGSGSEADRCLAQARSLGMDIEPYLTPLAAAAFAEANALLDKRQYSAAETALASIEEKYASTPWFTSRKQALSAARAAAKTGIHETEAENLYSEAAELFAQKEFFDLKPIVEKLKSDYASTAPVADATRKPSLAELEKATSNLGRVLTVRLDGKGDFKSIQAAIDAAESNTLISIEDNGPYTEKLRIPKEKEALTIRGRRGRWPLITSTGARAEIDILVSVEATQSATLERAILAHGSPWGANKHCLAIDGCRRFKLRSVVLFMLGAGGMRVHTGSQCAIDDSLVIVSAGIGSGAGSAMVKTTNCLWLWGEMDRGSVGTLDVRSCTFLWLIRLSQRPSAIIDSIVQKLDFDDGFGHRVEFSNVISKAGVQDSRKPGQLERSCLSADPMFRDPANLDFRLKPGSPCIGRASDGGDIGCRYTPEMIELCKQALELRRRGILKF